MEHLLFLLFCSNSDQGIANTLPLRPRFYCGQPGFQPVMPPVTLPMNLAYWKDSSLYADVMPMLGF
jgi:hypothetical protein